MAIDAETYRQAAEEHVTAARELYDLGRYALAHYVSGLAVECILRAYRHRIDPEFDARHDLDRLYKLAGFSDIARAGKPDAIGAAMLVVLTQWSNDFRYLSEASLRKRLSRLKLYRGIKGDFVKELTRRIIEASGLIVSTGVAAWKS